MQAAIKDFEAKGFKLYVIASGSKEELDYLLPLGHTVLLDPKGDAFTAYDITGIPQTYFVDREGFISWSGLGWGGQDSLDEFKAQVEKAVAGG